MTKKEIKDRLIKLLLKSQRKSGHEYVEITDKTVPYDNLPGFDSLILVEAIMNVSEELNYEFSGRDIFWTASHEKNHHNNIKEIVDKISNVINK